MRRPFCIIAVLFAVAAPAGAQSVGRAPGTDLALYTLRLQNIDGRQLAPALQQVIIARSVPDRPATSPAADTLVIAGRSVVVDSAFRAAVASERASIAPNVVQSQSPSQFVRLIAEVATNSLLARTSPYDWALIRQLVVRLDR